MKIYIVLLQQHKGIKRDISLAKLLTVTFYHVVFAELTVNMCDPNNGTAVSHTLNIFISL